MLSKIVTFWIQFVSNFHLFDETSYMLNRLSDRELGDMGITRSDIPMIAKGKFRRESI